MRKSKFAHLEELDITRGELVCAWSCIAALIVIVAIAYIKTH
jgi:hypothetical protein